LEYARGWYDLRADGVGTVRPVGGQGSHLVGDLTGSNCLIVVPEETTHVPPGARVGVTLERAPPSERPSRPLRLVAVRSGS